MKKKSQKQLQDDAARQELAELLAFCDGANVNDILHVHTTELAD